MSAGYLPEPVCCTCDKDADLHIFNHLPSGAPIVFCVTCASHEMARESARGQYQYKGRYLQVAEWETDRALDEAYHSLSPRGQAYAEAMQAPYDQMLEEYHAQTAQAEEMHKRRVDWIDLERQYDMPSDAVLDEYIDANPDKFQYVAYADNTEDTLLAGLRQWYDLRQSAIGG